MHKFHYLEHIKYCYNRNKRQNKGANAQNPQHFHNWHPVMKCLWWKWECQLVRFKNLTSDIPSLIISFLKIHHLFKSNSVQRWRLLRFSSTLCLTRCCISSCTVIFLPLDAVSIPNRYLHFPFCMCTFTSVPLCDRIELASDLAQTIQHGFQFLLAELHIERLNSWYALWCGCILLDLSSKYRIHLKLQ